MIIKSNGIVLNYIKYRETSIIARIFTKEKGYGAYIVNSIRSQRAKKSIGYFQPFSILELVLYVKDSRDIQRISEFRNHFPLHHIHHDFTKSSITLFLTEVLSKLLQSEQSSHPQLYTFITDAIKAFDTLEQGVENFHLQFLLKIASYLGFAIDEFDTLFTSINKLAPTHEHESLWRKLMDQPYGSPLQLNREARNLVLDAVLNYYHHHANLPRPKSLDVLRNVLD